MSLKFGTCYWMVQISYLPLANSQNTCLETSNLSLVSLLAKTTNKTLQLYHKLPNSSLNSHAAYPSVLSIQLL